MLWVHQHVEHEGSHNSILLQEKTPYSKVIDLTVSCIQHSVIPAFVYNTRHDQYDALFYIYTYLPIKLINDYINN